MHNKKSNNFKQQPGIWECILTDLKTGMAGLVIEGSPKIVSSPYGNSVQFDGSQDGLFLKNNPLKGLSCFTVEVLFRPDLNGPEEQRFLHIGEIDGDRLLIETRLTENGLWFLDTYIQSGQSQKTLIDQRFIDPVGPWYHIALTLDKHGQMVNYVNGKLEIKGKVSFNPVNSGEMSIGVRRNKVSRFKGAINKIRINPLVLSLADFMPF
jgi:hypothetical protein